MLMSPKRTKQYCPRLLRDAATNQWLRGRRCGFSGTKELLKNMRKIDDIIVSTINSVVPTDSFKANPTESCKELYKQLHEGNTKRENVIRNCVNITTERVKDLKEQRESNDSDIQLSKSLRTEQTKLRMLQMELNVEDLIRQRTSKVFNEKCRKYYRPE